MRYISSLRMRKYDYDFQTPLHMSVKYQSLLPQWARIVPYKISDIDRKNSKLKLKVNPRELEYLDGAVRLVDKSDIGTKEFKINS